MPLANSPHGYKKDAEAEFDYLYQKAIHELDAIPLEQVDTYSGMDDEAIVRNLRKTSGDLLTDALNMALEEASQFVMEQSSDHVDSTGQGYNLVELSPFDSSGNSASMRYMYRGASPGYQTDTSISQNMSLDDTMTPEGMHTDFRDARNAQQQELSNVQYEITSATNLLYGSDQHGYEHNTQDTYHTQHCTDSVLQNQLQNISGLSSKPFTNAGTCTQNLQHTSQWSNTNNNFMLLQGSNIPKPEGSNMAVPVTSQLPAIPQVVDCMQDLERSFLEEMASIDLPTVPASHTASLGTLNMPPYRTVGIRDSSTVPASVTSSSNNTFVGSVVPGSNTYVPANATAVPADVLPGSNTCIPASGDPGSSSSTTYVPVSAASTPSGGVPANNTYITATCNLVSNCSNTYMPTSAESVLHSGIYAPSGVCVASQQHLRIS